MAFTHYDVEEIEFGGSLLPPVPQTTYTGPELIVLVVMIVLGIGIAMRWGILAMLIVMAMLVPVALYWQRSRLDSRAVWFCTPCDRYFIGRRLIPWKAR